MNLVYKYMELQGMIYIKDKSKDIDPNEVVLAISEEACEPILHRCSRANARRIISAWERTGEFVREEFNCETGLYEGKKYRPSQMYVLSIGEHYMKQSWSSAQFQYINHSVWI